MTSPTAFPVCEWTFDAQTCGLSGDHLCAPRVAHVCAFFVEILVHTKGKWARRPFRPARWQRDGILTPLFGRVRWSPEHDTYVRQYRIAWIELARKNGKSELLAGVALYLLIADGEEGAEIYGCARDRDQARKVYDVAERMRALSPELSKRIKPYVTAKRMVDDTTASYYEILAADAAGNLGHNPHGIIFDEVLTQRDGRFWHAMRTSMGARTQPLLLAATTAGDDPQSFAKLEHDEMVRIHDDPSRAPHVFVYMRNLPADADPWDEANWFMPNPALEDFLSIESLREEAMEAKNDPTKENAWRQFRCNQWVSQASRWMPMHLFDDNAGPVWAGPDEGRARLAGRLAYAGFDMSAKRDLTAWCLLLPPGGDDDPEGPVQAMWRFWLPEEGLRKLDRVNDNKFSGWANNGWLTICEGTVIDYDQVLADIAKDVEHFNIAAIDCDEWSMWPLINQVADVCHLSVDRGDLLAYRNTYDRMSGGMDDLMTLAKTNRLQHHANPVARFCFDVCEVRHAPYDPNLVRPVKPDRDSHRSRIDGVPAAVMAVNAMKRHMADGRRSAYEGRGLMIL